VVETEAKGNAKEVDERRLEEQAQAMGIAADAKAKRVAAEAQVKRDATEVERRRLEEQAQGKRIVPDVEAKRVLVEGVAKRDAKEVERRRLEGQAEVNVSQQLSLKNKLLESWQKQQPRVMLRRYRNAGWKRRLKATELQQMQKPRELW
jgi:hypothetical protein